MNISKLSIAAFATVLVACFAPPAFAQSTSYDIEVGYQSVDVEGNEDMFRTQINQDDGFVLRGFTINLIDPTGEMGIADRLRIDASGFGGNPAGRFRLDMGLGTTYRLFVFYQQLDSFSALPAYANPLLDDGVYPGQHTWDRTRDLLDIRLELLPGRTITPIFGYRWNSYDGPGLTTYSVGSDEFRIASDIEETEQEYYLGLAFATNAVQGTFIQGWRDFKGTVTESLAPGEGVGNNPGTTIGQEIELLLRPQHPHRRRHPGHDLPHHRAAEREHAPDRLLRAGRLRGRHDPGRDALRQPGLVLDLALLRGTRPVGAEPDREPLLARRSPLRVGHQPQRRDAGRLRGP